MDEANLPIARQLLCDCHDTCVAYLDLVSDVLRSVGYGMTRRIMQSATRCTAAIHMSVIGFSMTLAT